MKREKINTAVIGNMEVKVGLIIEPPIFKEVENHIGRLMDMFTTPNIPAYVILNKAAYSELVEFYLREYKIERYPDTILDYPIVLDMESNIRVKVVSSPYTEYTQVIR
jgi:hypothetical protein